MNTTFKQYLIEKRSHAAQNPKLSAYKQLEPYKNDPDIYISYTKIQKIGINPSSTFNTPNGIYTYPLKEIWKEFDKSSERVDVGHFTDGRPYIWILKQSCNKFVNDLKKDYTSADYDKDMLKIRNLYSKKYAPIKKNVEYFQDKIDKFLDERGAYYMANSDGGKRTKEEVLKILKTFPEYTADIESLRDENDRVGAIIEKAGQSSRIMTPGGMFWNITRWLANNGKDPETQGFASNANFRWNTLLQNLGYCGFGDKSNTGIIHPSERTQAVFLTKKAFTVIGMINNVSPKISMTAEGLLQHPNMMSIWSTKMTGNKITWTPNTDRFPRKYWLFSGVDDSLTSTKWINKATAKIILSALDTPERTKQHADLIRFTILKLKGKIDLTPRVSGMLIRAVNTSKDFYGFPRDLVKIIGVKAADYLYSEAIKKPAALIFDETTENWKKYKKTWHIR